MVSGGRRANSSIRRRVTEGSQERAAIGDGSDRGHELVGRVVLEEKAARAGAQRLVDVLVEIEGGERSRIRGGP